jgi:hypothetical protein
MCDNEGGMAVYHVFVDGAAEATSAGKEQLATNIASHYGMPIDAVRARIASGRFRVKGNCDRSTADTYVRDLTALGARCSIEEATSDNVAKTPLPFPAVTSPRPAQNSALPPRQTTPPAIARTSSGSKEYQSGLSAAFSGAQQTGGLGALGDEGAVFKLSSVDGKEDTAVAPAAVNFAPPASALPASIGPEAAKPSAKPAAAAKPDEPIDMFAPPDAADDNFAVHLAPDEVERAAKKKVSIPPETAPAEPAARTSRPSLQAPNRSSRPSLQPPLTLSSGPAATGLKDPKIRLLVGVLVSIVIGFIPAHFVASMREKSAFASVDASVAEVQKQVVTPEDYTALDPMRARQLERKRDDRRNIAMIALLIWAAGGAGVAFVFFKKIAPAPAADA